MPSHLRYATFAVALASFAACNGAFEIDALSFGAAATSASASSGGGAASSSSVISSSSSSSSGAGDMGGAGGGGGAAAGGEGGAGGDGFLNVGGSLEVTFGERSTSDVQGVTSDTWLNSNAPTQNFAADTVLDMDQTPLERALLRFDLSIVAPGTTVASAQLELVTHTGDSCGSTTGTISLHPLLESWVPEQATFNVRELGALWSEAGAGPASYGAVPLGSYAMPAVGAPETVTLDPAMVQGWIDMPASNHGMVLVNSTSNGACLTSSEGSSVRRPQLRLMLSGG